MGEKPAETEFENGSHEAEIHKHTHTQTHTCTKVQHMQKETQSPYLTAAWEECQIQVLCAFPNLLYIHSHFRQGIGVTELFEVSQDIMGPVSKVPAC